MTWRRRYLAQSNFLSTTSLAWSLALHLLFCSVRRSLYGGKRHVRIDLEHTVPWLYCIQNSSLCFFFISLDLTTSQFMSCLSLPFVSLWQTHLDHSKFMAQLMQKALFHNLLNFSSYNCRLRVVYFIFKMVNATVKIRKMAQVSHLSFARKMIY